MPRTSAGKTKFRPASIACPGRRAEAQGRHAGSGAALQSIVTVTLRLARRANEVNDVTLDGRRAINRSRDGAPRKGLLELDGGPGATGFSRTKTFEYFEFFYWARKIEQYLQEKPIELGSGYWENAVGIRFVHRRQHDERIGQSVGLAAEGYVTFLERFEQSGLRSRGRAVYFVEQHHVCKQRPEPRAKREIARVEDLGAQDISRHEIGRALDSGERAVDGPGERPACQRFGQTRSAFEQHVAVRDQREHERLDDAGLSDQNAAEGIAQRRWVRNRAAFKTGRRTKLRVGRAAHQTLRPRFLYRLRLDRRGVALMQARHELRHRQRNQREKKNAPPDEGRAD